MIILSTPSIASNSFCLTDFNISNNNITNTKQSSVKKEIINEESNELKLQLNYKEKEYKKTHEELARTKTQMNRILNRKYQANNSIGEENR